MKVAITGSSGMIGTALRTFFHGRGDAVTRVVRPQSPKGDGTEVVWNVERGAIDAAGLEGHDLVIHLAGESIAGVWTSEKKRRIRESRVRGTALLADALASLRSPPKALFSASGVDYYGDRGEEELTERSAPGSGFLPEVVQEWEDATGAAQEAGIRVVMMRNGLVLSPHGGVLEVLLPLFRLGLGGKVGDGRQCWPWIALDEIPPAVAHLIDHPEVGGPVNFVAPEIVSNAEFTNRLAAAVDRPAFFALPAFAAKLAPGDMAEEMLLSSKRTRPLRLEESGYRFRYPELRPALKVIRAPSRFRRSSDGRRARFEVVRARRRFGLRLPGAEASPGRAGDRPAPAASLAAGPPPSAADPPLRGSG